MIKAVSKKNYDLCREYLAKAKEAEGNADKCSDKELRRAWRKIADGYLRLANHFLARGI